MKNLLFKPKNKEELTESLCEAYKIPKPLMESYNKRIRSNLVDLTNATGRTIFFLLFCVLGLLVCFVSEVVLNYTQYTIFGWTIFSISMLFFFVAAFTPFVAFMEHD